ncbi:MAG: Rieske 2Fe-2S domain-containing protein [Pseudobacteriovorax sp.]|nr:Rieske 2Fe-2S domain-containing protein [Pseudobacteriovorax sp.]
MNWRQVCSAEFPKFEMKAIELDDKPYILIRHDEGCLCYFDRCSHQDVKLSEFGSLTDKILVCFAHGVEFDLTSGQRLSGPQCGNLSPIPCKVEGGDIWVSLP